MSVGLLNHPVKGVVNNVLVLATLVAKSLTTSRTVAHAKFFEYAKFPIM
jgi:hypothetical protein